MVSAVSCSPAPIGSWQVTAPLQAVLVQAVVMFLVLAATATTTVVIALGLIRRMFTPDHRLIYLPTPADH